MNLAIILTHNKTDAENAAQIEAILPLITKVTETVPVYPPEGGDPIGTQDIYHYELKGLSIPHELRCYQIVPFGVTPPANIRLIDSHNVLYGKGDEDKTGDHPRFFNWGLKRATDYGAEIAVYLEDPSQLTGTKVRNAVAKLVNDTEYVETTWGRLGTLRLLKEVGQLREDRTFTQAISDLKTRVTQKGLKNG